MNAQQLRNSILQQAIQGKLVPQDPADEPASVLLQRIRKEKEHLVKEGKLKKKDLESKPIEEDEIPFEIPKGWEWCRFSDLYWQLTDGTHSTPKYREQGVPFLSVKDMSGGKLSFSNTKFISSEEHALLSQRCHPQKGDLLISKVGTTGIPLIIDTDKEFSIFVSLALIKFFPRLIDSSFLLFLINSPLVQSQVKENTRGVGNKNWVLSAISNTIMVLPPLAEQRRIVAKIEELMPLVERYGKAQQALDQLNESLPSRLRQSILQEAIQGRLVPQDPKEEPASKLLKRIRKEKEQLVKEGKLKKKDLESKPIEEDEIPFEIPESWEWCRLKEAVCNHGQKVPDKRFSYIDIGSIDNKRQRLNEKENVIEVKDAPSRARRIVKKDDIVYSTVRPYLHNVTIVDKEFSEEPIASTGFAVFSCFNGVYNKFLFYYLLSPEFDKYANDGDNAKGVAYPAINDEKLYKAIVPLPPLSEQKRIVAKVEELFGVMKMK